MRCLIALLTVCGTASGAPADADLLDRASRSYQTGQAAKAAELYRQYLREHGERADVRVFLGAALLATDDASGALEQSRAALAVDPQFGKAYTLAGRVQASRSNWEAADALFARAIELDRGDRDAWYFRGRALYEAQRFDTALGYLTKAAELGGHHSYVLEMLALTYEALGRPRDAEPFHARAVQVAGDAFHPYLSFGIFLAKEGRAGESIMMLERALQVNPTSVDVRFELSRVLYREGRLERALALIARPVIASDGDCRVLHLRGRVLQTLGQTEAARIEARALSECFARSDRQAALEKD